MSAKIDTYKIRKWTVIGRRIFPPPYRITDELINEARIVHVVHGRSKLYSANQVIDMKSGDTLIMKTDKFVNQWLENEDGEPNRVIVFQLTSEFLQYIYQNQSPLWFKEKQPSISNAVEKVDDHPLIHSFFDNLNIYLNNPRFATEEITQLKIKELLALMVSINMTGSIQRILENLFKAPEYEFQEVIQKNIYEDLHIEELAFLTGMSLSSFKRKFASFYGTSPNKYIISKRLERAQSLLRTTDLNISEIAYDCGFSDLGYFSKTFRKYYHVSPSDFKKEVSD